MRKSLFLFLVLVMLLGGIATACATAPTDTSEDAITTKRTPSPLGKEMILVGESQDIQVYKMTDNITGVICYVTINSERYNPSSIFCVK
jgi:hypothetical protein